MDKKSNLNYLKQLTDSQIYELASYLNFPIDNFSFYNNQLRLISKNFLSEIVRANGQQIENCEHLELRLEDFIATYKIKKNYTNVYDPSGKIISENTNNYSHSTLEQLEDCTKRLREFLSKIFPSYTIDAFHFDKSAIEDFIQSKIDKIDQLKYSINRSTSLLEQNQAELSIAQKELEKLMKNQPEQNYTQPGNQ